MIEDLNDDYDSDKRSLMTNTLVSTGEGTIFSSFFNITNTIIGGGLLALPYAMSNCGLILGSFLVLICALSAGYSSQLLINCALPPINAGTTLSEMNSKIFGEKAGPIIMNLILILFQSGALIGYVTIVGDLIYPYASRIAIMDKSLVTFVISAFTMYPLVNLKFINSLRFTSLAAIVLITYNVFVILTKSIIIISSDWESTGIKLFSFSTNTLASLPIISFAYTYHANILVIWTEMKTPSKSNILKANWASVSLCFIVYLSVGVLGYLAYIVDIGDNIMLELKNDFFVDFGKLGYAFIICFSYPVLGYPVRDSLDKLIFPKKQPASRLRITIEATILYAVTFFLGVTVPGISIVFGISGSTVGAMLVFLLPSTYYLHLKKSPHEDKGKYPWWVYRYFRFEKIGAILVFLFGLVIMVGGTFSVIYSLAKN